MPRNSSFTPEKFTTFGELLRFLRRKADLTQREFSIAVGYSESQISRLEQNERAPEEATLAARFVPALYIDDEPLWAARLLELGSATRSHASNTEASQPIAEAKPTPHNLPIQLTSFIGREKEITEIKKLLAKGEGSVRLLTLTGHGGCGKTRLALESAFGMLNVFRDGVWLIELAPLADPALVPGTVAAVLGLKEEAGRPILSTLTDHLRGKRILLIFDNCEHLIQASAILADALLHACPAVHLLATSREALGVSGESALVVPSLSMPPDFRNLQDFGSLSQYEAVRLFTERAVTVMPGFTLTDENAIAIAQICQRLDGIPLAIELAAARLRMLPVEQVAARLDDAFRLLTGGNRTALPRHQTLQALIDWSYELLTQAEQVVFRRLAVFAGGWTLEAAEAVCIGEEIKTDEVFDLLAHLLDKSLVLTEEEKKTARYRMLETIRQYALAKLAASGEADTVRGRHAAYYLTLAEAVLELPPQLRQARNDHMETEHDNMRAALAWRQSAQGSAELKLRLARALGWFWITCGYWSEGRGWLEDALKQADEERVDNKRLRALALGQLSFVCTFQGDYEAAEAHNADSLQFFQELGDIWESAFILSQMGWLARERDDVITARARLEECVAIFKELGDEFMIANSTNTLAEAIILQGEVNLAKTMLEDNLVLARKVGYTETIGWALNHLGHVAQEKDEFEQAVQFHEKSLALFLQMGTQNEGTIWAHQSLGESRLAQGDSLLAYGHFTESLASCDDLGDRAGMAWCLAGLAGVAALNEEPERAAWLWGAAEALRQSIGTRQAPAARATRERLQAEVRKQLGEDMFNAKWAEGQSASMKQAIAEATL